jgi:hypothetical protein
MELLLALATGITVGAAVLVAFGVPDRRIGPAGIAAVLRDAGLPVESVRPAEVEARGSRPFAAVTADGRMLFVKALGSDQRDADLLYRAYRAVRLRNVGDTWPAASLFHAVEHQALVELMAERAGVSAPGVDRVVRAGDAVLLVKPWADGCSLDRLSAGQLGDDLLARLWAEVGKLHRADIAHRSLRAANVMAGPAGRPTIVDFSFSELDATQRDGAAAVLAHGADSGRLLVHQPGVAGQRGRHGPERPLPAENRGRAVRGGRRRRGQRAGRGHRPRGPAGDLPRLGRPRSGPGVQAAVEQQAAADPGLYRRPHASVAAFGARASIAQVGAVYLVASFIAAASPTPGGLGAIEAATIAGLTSIGISSGPAVSAVLIYRLATYWLPVLPGWYSWRLLQRMDYL